MSGPFNRRRQARNGQNGQIPPMSQEELQADLDEMNKQIEERKAAPHGSYSLSSGYIDENGVARTTSEGLAEANEEHRAAIQHGAEVHQQRQAEEQAEADQRDPERVKRREAHARGDIFEVHEHDAPAKAGQTSKEFWVRSIDRLGGAQFQAAFPTREAAEEDIRRRKQKMQDDAPKRKAQDDFFARLFGAKKSEE